MSRWRCCGRCGPPPPPVNPGAPLFPFHLEQESEADGGAEDAEQQLSQPQATLRFVDGPPPGARRLGSFLVSPIGFGQWPLSDKGRPEESETVEQVQRAVRGGVTLIDTAAAYCLDESEFHHGPQRCSPQSQLPV
jgi:hypothetical protein